MADPMAFVAPPRRPARRGGIKAVVGEFVAQERLGAAAGIQWISQGCTFPKSAPGLCYQPAPPTGDKTFEGVEWGSGPIFGLYEGVQCFLNEESDYDARARALLEAGEDRAIEDELWKFADTIDAVAPGTLSIIAAVGWAEEAADSNYLGQPVILMSRTNSIRAAAESILGFDRDGNIWTPNGTPVLASGEFPDGFIMVIGWPSVYVSPFVVTRGMDWRVNQEMAIAERIYGLAIDCNFAGKITVAAPATQQQPNDPEEPLDMILGSIPSSPIPDGTDTTIIVQTNVVPTAEVFLHYSVNGGPDTTAGEMTQTNPHEFVWNVVGDSTGAGDSVEVWAVSLFDGNDVESNHITIEVT